MSTANESKPAVLVDTPIGQEESPGTKQSRTPQVGEATRERATELKRRLIVAAIFAVPVMALSMIPALQFPGWQWLVAALSMPVVVWAAWPFHVAAFRAARHGSSTMDTLVSMGVIAASLWSLWALFFGGAGEIGMTMNMSFMPKNASTEHAEIYFEAATMVTTFLLAGRYAEARTRYRAGDALRSLLELGAKSANRVKPEGGIEVVPVDDLQVDDIVVVKPGEKIPVDAVVESGHAALDTSLLTGESIPVHVGPGDEVTGATINTDGQLTVRVTRVGEDTTLARIGQMVTEAQAGKAPVQRLADRISAVFVPAVIIVAILTLIGWLIWGPGVQPAFTAAVAVLVIACPCALGLATPTALLVGSGRAAQLGIVIKGPEILESTRRIDTMVLDKTGTVTKAEMHVVDSFGDPQALSAAAAVEAGSSHPVAEAIVEAFGPDSSESTEGTNAGDSTGDSDAGDSTESAAAQDESPASPSTIDATDFVNHAGAGVSATIDDQRVFVGSPAWIEQIGFSIESVQSAIDQSLEQGATVSVVAIAPISDIQISEDDSDSRVEAPAVELTAEDDGKWTVDVAVGGMTCASCVNRVERKLGKIPGVTAQVNLATEAAHITLDDESISNEQLIETIEKAGYTATVQGRQQAHSANVNAPVQPTLTQWRNPKVAGGEAAAVIAVADEIKSSSSEAVKQLRDLGIEPILVTGDNERAAQHVAEQVGITKVYANVLPDEKRDVVADLQDQGRIVAMVGDGVNDAAALAQAGSNGLGMAMGSGTEVAIEAADITLVGSDLRSAAQAIRISRNTLRVIKQNLFWAFAYNVAAIPLAIAGLLNPMIAGAAMAMSSIIVVTNSLRLRAAEK
ncbi:MAG: heavy metal translocating P-type ATPase [Acidobacteriota bacterium]|nr:heavy metal translocating P-type ATPase [Acidobacteriota bacterium]